ncbi:MAG: NleE/OspZ family T3SS effector cysteine methyltransferase [Endozoicomonas sp.]
MDGINGAFVQQVSAKYEQVSQLKEHNCKLVLFNGKVVQAGEELNNLLKRNPKARVTPLNHFFKNLRERKVTQADTESLLKINGMLDVLIEKQEKSELYHLDQLGMLGAKGLLKKALTNDDKKHVKGLVLGECTYLPNCTAKAQFLNKRFRSHYHENEPDKGYQRMPAKEGYGPELSIMSVLSGKRPMTRLEVKSLFDPDLVALTDIPGITFKVVHDSLENQITGNYHVYFYRSDSRDGAARMDKLMSLYNDKIALIEKLKSSGYSQNRAALFSEVKYGADIGRAYNYSEPEIQEFLEKVKDMFRDSAG